MNIEFFNLKMTRSTFSPLTITQRTETFSSSILFSFGCAVPWSCYYHWMTWDILSVVRSENTVMWSKLGNLIGRWDNIHRFESHTNDELANVCVHSPWYVYEWVLCFARFYDSIEIVWIDLVFVNCWKTYFTIMNLCSFNFKR